MEWPNFKEERRNAGITNLRDLAAAMGLSVYTLADIEDGKVSVDEKTQTAIRLAIAKIATDRAERAAEMAAA